MAFCDSPGTWIKIGMLALLLLAPSRLGRNLWKPLPAPVPDALVAGAKVDSFAFRLIVPEAVPIRKYFPWMDSLVLAYDSLVPYPLTEHLIVRANPWIIDSLEQTDYYLQKEKGRFIYDQAGMPALRKGDTLGIPGPEMALRILARIAHTVIDVNIPEYTLRILEGTDTLYTFPVRVGRNERKYLEMAGRVVDLRTAVGEGSIVRIERYPAWINPSDCKPYEVTRRDDGLLTACPQIPWLEPEINGQRLGHLIHPTTNPRTLGRAYSNGCIGTKEGDAWVVYYHAPSGTRVVFRYDLWTVGPEGDTVRLRNVYRR
jgi:L,D-transpeptidase ErfK/SrfK